MMTSKEKYLAKIASKESKAVIDAKERLKNEKWLKESSLDYTCHKIKK